MIVGSLVLAFKAKKVKQQVNIYVSSPEVVHNNPLHHTHMNEIRV